MSFDQRMVLRALDIVGRATLTSGVVIAMLSIMVGVPHLLDGCIIAIAGAVMMLAGVEHD